MLHRRSIVAASALLILAGRQALGSITRGQGDFAAAAGMRVVVTLTLPGQRPAQERFTPKDQA